LARFSIRILIWLLEATTTMQVVLVDLVAIIPLEIGDTLRRYLGAEG
jgi:hypothetical protein